MKSITKFVGLDVSKDTISVAVADAGRTPARSMGSIPNTPEAVRKLIRRLGKPEELLVCYEAGPTGYGLYRFVGQLQVTCIVVVLPLTLFGRRFLKLAGRLNAGWRRLPPPRGRYVKLQTHSLRQGVPGGRR